jgi:outer membrane receptor protein involved in Fe transport
MAAALARSGSARAEDDTVVRPELPVLMLTGFEQEAVEEELDESLIVRTAAKRVVTVQESAAIVTVVTRDQILVRGYRTLADVLDDIPAFEAYRPNTGNRGFFLEHMARGNARTILVLWNGVPINTPETNERALREDLPLAVIDRIEILSGPGGVMWGANAFLGIVSLTTRRGDDLDGRAEVEMLSGTGGGSQATYGASASVAEAFRGGDVAVFANLTYYSSRDAALDQLYDTSFGPFLPPHADGAFQFLESSGPTVNDRDHYLPLTLAIDVGRLRLDVFYPILFERRFELSPQALRVDHYIHPVSGFHDGTTNNFRNTVALASATVELSVDDDTELTGRAYYTAFDDEGVVTISPAGHLNPTEALLTEARYAGKSSVLRDGAVRAGVTVDAARAGRTHHVVAGVDGYVETLRDRLSRTLGGFTTAAVQEELHISLSGRRFVLAAFANDQWRLARRLQLTGGVRGQVAPGSYDPLLLGSAALLWSPRDDVYCKLNVAQGFRPPALRIVLTNSDPRSLASYPHIEGNPDLQAERSLAVETEVSALVLRGQRRIRYLGLQVGYQLTRLDDLVVEVNGRSENAARRVLHSGLVGANLALSGGHRITAAYSVLYGKDSETGPIRQIANHKLNLGGELQINPWLQGVVRLVLYGPREDLNRLPETQPDGSLSAFPSIVVVDRTPPVGLIHAGLRAPALWQRFDVALLVQNMFNNEFAVPDPAFDKRLTPSPFYAPGLAAFLTVTGRL